MKIDALGFLEVRGLVAAIEAADAMLKAADVKLIRSHQVDPRFFTLVVEGDLAACRAAVDAGKAAASRLGEVVSRLEIGRPDGDTEAMVLDLVDRSKGEAPKARPAAGETAAALPAAAGAGKAGGAPTPATPAPVAPAADEGVDTPGTAASGVDTPGVDTPAAAVPDEVALLAFIAASARGRSLAELAAHFGPAVDRVRLDALVAAGRLRKAGARYRVVVQ
ncbi:BMC domain-containing protein [Thauera butanivorans]|uniref:BMC domain-containing protein n=1 Tax=Thauera butanivorans TaxID=86174 RepID=UPI00083930ED|nr:BMC domain-containing protein [Thauera butanivorans]